MRLILQILIILLCFSCNYMKEISLYEPSEEEEPNSVEKFSQKVIFLDSASSGIWGTNEHSCKQISFNSENNYTSKDHLHIRWNKTEACKYLGMGFTWDSYKKKNLNPVLDNGAIQLMIRTDSGSYTKPPIFFSLVDYSGKQCITKINYLGIEGGEIDTSWTKITIPLQTFNYAQRGVNMSNIKELKIEFQRKGSIHLDDIRIVSHQHNYKKSNENFRKTFTEQPINIGTEKEYWWGINPRYSNNFTFISNTEFTSELALKKQKVIKLPSVLSEALNVTFNANKNQIWNNFGFAIYKWKHVDLATIYSSSAIQFKIKANKIPKLKTTILSYSGKTRAIHTVVTEKNYSKIQEGYYKVCIPLKSFSNFKQLNWSDLKEIRFKLLENSNFKIGDFKIIEFRGNPQKPN